MGISTMTEIKIGSRPLGKGHPVFIIAEAGINHNGDLEKAYAMIQVAKDCGADAIKFQTFHAEEFISDPNLTYTYASQGQEVTESMLEMFKRYEFETEQWHLLRKKCDDTGILFLSTPQNPSNLELLLQLDISAIKVGSDDFTNLPLLAEYAKTGLPMLLSCGMADLAEVYQSLETVGTMDGYPTVLLLCTSQYPTPPEDVHLSKLQTLAQLFPGLVLGFSDHTQGELASSLAVALGACVFEKHFTLSHDLPGPDHWFSSDPAELRQWVQAIRTAHTMMGQPMIRPTAKEQDMRILARRSVVALQPLQPGETLTAENIGLRRPGDGLTPGFLPKIIGLKATKALSKGQKLLWGDFAP